MLSKLHPPAAPRSDTFAALLPALRAYFAQVYGPGLTVAPLPGAGTLGVCFAAQTVGGPLVVKTHLPGAAHRQSIKKEAVLLRALYGKAVLRDVVELSPCGSETYTLLVMEQLQPLDTPLAPPALAQLIENYTHCFAALGQESLAQITPAMADFAAILQAARTALAALHKKGLLTNNTVLCCETILEKLTLAPDAPNSPRVLCHGDLSNKNILQRDGRLFVIDWEDAFWGPPDYDFYYWLTFFDQRPLYTQKAFSALPVQNPLGISIMVAVVLVKCHLSVLSGSCKTHRISCQDRLAEILRIG